MPGHTRPAPARDHAHTTKTAVDPTCSVCAIRDAYQPRFSTRPRAPSGITIDDLGRDPPKWRDLLTRSATGGRMAGPTKRDPQGPRQRLHHDCGGPSQLKWRDRPWQEQAHGPQRGTDQPNHNFHAPPASNPARRPNHGRPGPLLRWITTRCGPDALCAVDQARCRPGRPLRVGRACRFVGMTVLALPWT